MNIKELRKITSTDKFTEMPLSTQAYYFHLFINADKDNFVQNPKAIQRFLEADDEDLEILEFEKYIVKNEDYGVTLNDLRDIYNG
ncbi:hypothetical protein [Enterococcus cecorum]|uniref:hypothetical protein n=1 Tax=Enterococcus cecorum TaxID=44008 RepID=UPI00200AB1A5|nr:hypothetical protein [Enterococcus cecorum]